MTCSLLGLAASWMCDAPRRFPSEQLIVCSDAVKNHRVAANPVNQQEVGAEMALGHAGPVRAALIEMMFPERVWQGTGGNQDIEDILKSLGFEFWVLSRRTIVALKARQDD